MKIFVFLLLTFHSTFAAKNYTGYTLLRNIPLTENEVDFMKNLSQIFEINYWRSPGAIKKPVDILVSPDDKPRLLKTFDDKKYYYTTIIEDVQRLFDEETIKPYIRRNMASFNFKNFFNLEDINNWMFDIARAFPNKVKIYKIGETFEKRDILSMSIALKNSNLRSTVIIEGGIHAREWISPAAVCYIIKEIVYSSNSADAQWKNIALTYRWYIVPIVNPDGYAYSFEKDRLWRKNRRDGHGIDVNRNFDIGFGSVGVSKRKTSEIYCGPHAFSEQESIAVKTLVSKVHKNLEFYLAFHSYGNLMILPYSHSKRHKENYDEMSKILRNVKKAISRRYGTRYKIGTAFDTVGYITSGVSGCWVKKEYKVPYVVTFELSDDGKYGFALPPNKILPTCKEIMDGLKVLLAPIENDSTKLLNENIPNRQSCCSINFEIILFTVILFVQSIRK